LRVDDLQLLRKRITVTRNAVRSGGAVEVGTPKSGRGRTVPIRGPACRDVDAVAGQARPRGDRECECFVGEWPKIGIEIGSDLR
jgi:hypothetical protein